jgi:hypothetical protein
MHLIKNCLLILSLVLACEAVLAQGKSKHKKKKIAYEVIDFEDMMRRYFGKEKSDPLEGIYTVSCVITKKSKQFLSRREKTRVVGRKDNYARIAVLKDWAGSKRDYIEISLSYHAANLFPIVGELNTLSDGQGFIYKHIEPDGVPISFSMVNESVEMLEAEYSDMQKRKTITYKLSYLKTYPKSSTLTAFQN